MKKSHLQCHQRHTKFHPNPPIGLKVINWFPCTHLKSQVSHFGMVETTPLEGMASRSPSMALTAYHI
jgi:hypothetical protein